MWPTTAFSPAVDGRVRGYFASHANLAGYRQRLLSRSTYELSECDGWANDPSPVALRLVKAPDRDTLSPRERARRQDLRRPLPDVIPTLSPIWLAPSPHGRGLFNNMAHVASARQYFDAKASKWHPKNTHSLCHY